MKKEVKDHYRKVVDIGCIICLKMGYPDSPAEIHHIKENFMFGKKSDYQSTIPLCPAHHRTTDEAYHHSPKSFTEKWGSQKDLLKETLELIK